MFCMKGINEKILFVAIMVHTVDVKTALVKNFKEAIH